jgi:hypothetical protein
MVARGENSFRRWYDTSLWLSPYFEHRAIVLNSHSEALEIFVGRRAG